MLETVQSRSDVASYVARVRCQQAWRAVNNSQKPGSMKRVQAAWSGQDQRLTPRTANNGLKLSVYGAQHAINTTKCWKL